MPAKGRGNNWVKLIVPGIVAAVIGAISAGFISGVLIPFIKSGGPEKDIREVIEQEASLVLAGRIDEALLLFNENAFIKDAVGGSKEWETVWMGQKGIRERYAQLPRFTYLRHDAIDITLSSDGKYARATADTMGEYIVGGKKVKISSNRGEKWTLEKIAGEWKITSFTYNLP